MKPKPSEILCPAPAYQEFFIGLNDLDKNCFKTEQDAQNWLNELDLLSEYKKRMLKAEEENKILRELLRDVSDLAANIISESKNTLNQF